MNRNKLLLLIIFLISGLTCCENASSGKEQQQEKGKKKKDKDKKEEVVSSEVEVINKWEMPEVLKEVSGIAFLGPNRFACVQDETGTVFIYNTADAKIIKEIPFGGAGDYEGIAVVGKTAYVVQSDGNIIEVNNIETTSPQVKTYGTSLTADQNVEGLCYDKKHNRLLLAIKGAEAEEQNFKGIYGFDLQSKKLQPEPVLKIDLTDAVFSGSKGKKLSNAMQPSEINVHPVTGDIYLTEATKPKILILDEKGKIKSLFHLSGSEFSQPEGIAFSPQGDLFISNEGKKESGNILQVKIANP